MYFGKQVKENTAVFFERFYAGLSLKYSTCSENKQEKKQKTFFFTGRLVKINTNEPPSQCINQIKSLLLFTAQVPW